MNIAYVARRAIPSEHAHAVQIVKMCEAFGKLGNRTTLFATTGESPPETAFERYGVERLFDLHVQPDGKGLIANLRFIRRMLADPRAKAADLFYGRDIKGVAAAALTGKPVVYEAHIMPPRRSFRRGLLKWLFARPNFSHLVCITTTAADLHRREFPSLAGKPIVVAPSAAAETDAPTADLPDWPGRSGRVQVGFTGRPFPGKGIEAMATAARALPDLDFHIVGSGREEVTWIEGELPPNLNFHGYQPHARVAAYLERFAIVAAPYGARVMNASGVESAATTSPLKLVEYMAACKPIIVSDLPGVRDILEGCECALVVPPGDDAAFVEALCRLAADEPLRERLGRAAQAHYRDRHTMLARARAVLAPLTLGDREKMPATITKSI
jgi:glycosyltransferase involved in cell wall biosynthesis